MHIEEIDTSASDHESELEVIAADDLHVGNAYHRFAYVSAYPGCPGPSGQGESSGNE